MQPALLIYSYILVGRSCSGCRCKCHRYELLMNIAHCQQFISVHSDTDSHVLCRAIPNEFFKNVVLFMLGKALLQKFSLSRLPMYEHSPRNNRTNR